MTTQELVTIAPKDAMAIFTADDPEVAFAPILARVREAIDGFDADISTAKSRKDIASIAYKVAQSRTYLETVGKGLADEAKALPKKIDASRRYVKTTLEAWQDEVRKPLTEWELVEKERVARHAAEIERLSVLSNPNFKDGRSLSAHDLRENLQIIEAVDIGPHCEEFEAEYARAKDNAIAALLPAIEARETYEAEQVELAELRRQAAEREAKEREERLKTEAAERAQIEAEQAVAAERERFEAAAKAYREAAERHELELKLQAEKAERRALETEQRLKREAEEAKVREAEETARREADREHRASINRAAVQAFVDGGIDEAMAKQIVSLIARKAIPAISISY